MNEIWGDEPDELNYEFEGYPIHIWRHPDSKHLCGYVGVDRSHPWFGKNYNDKVTVSSDILERLIDTNKIGAINLFIAANTELTDDKIPIVLAIDVHGGLTFAKLHPWFGRECLWWFGFDCAHCDDWSLYNQHGIYRTMDYVKTECENLVKQLKRIVK